PAPWKLSPSGEPIVWKDIKDRREVAGVFTRLLGEPAKRQGRLLLWRCPFHDDQNPSFQVDPDRRTWTCWPCGLKSRDAPELVMGLNGVGFTEAVRIVAELACIVAPSGKSRRAPPRPATVRKPGKAASKPLDRSSGLSLAEALSLVTEAANRLWKPEG